VRAYSQEEHLRGVTKDSALEWKLRDHGLFIAFAPVAQPKYACACLVEHGAVGHPQVLMARDILLHTQKRDPLGMPAAYPVKAASLPGRPVR
jgi:penicillin-binding protein 2